MRRNPWIQAAVEMLVFGWFLATLFAVLMVADAAMHP